MRKRSWLTKVGRFFRSTTAVVALTFTALGAPLFVYAHNLQTKMVYMFFDPNTQAMLDARIAADLPGPARCCRVSDELGIIIKVVPRDGTTTGVGGHVDFYVPNGVQVSTWPTCCPATACGRHHRLRQGADEGSVADRHWRRPRRRQGHAALVGLSGTDTNINGVTERPVAAAGLHLGTIAGVYGDTGIFFSTDPDTSYGSGSVHGEAPAVCGSLARWVSRHGKTITNNSGDVFVPCNKWDAEQMLRGASRARPAGDRLHGGTAHRRLPTAAATRPGASAAAWRARRADTSGTSTGMLWRASRQ